MKVSKKHFRVERQLCERHSSSHSAMCLSIVSPCLSFTFSMSFTCLTCLTALTVFSVFLLCLFTSHYRVCLEYWAKLLQKALYRTKNFSSSWSIVATQTFAFHLDLQLRNSISIRNWTRLKHNATASFLRRRNVYPYLVHILSITSARQTLVTSSVGQARGVNPCSELRVRVETDAESVWKELSQGEQQEKYFRGAK